jgi:hypothetical protein
MEGGRGPVFRYRSAGGVKKRTRPAVQFEKVYLEKVAQILNAPAVAAGPRQRSDAARNAKVQVKNLKGSGNYFGAGIVYTYKTTRGVGG